MLGQKAPVDPAAGYVQMITKLAARVAELERLSTRSNDWIDLTLASANWTPTRTPQWRYEHGRVWLRGTATRITSSFTAPGNLFALASGTNPPVPSQVSVHLGSSTITSALVAFHWVVDSSSSYFRSSSLSPTVAASDSVTLDGISWPT